MKTGTSRELPLLHAAGVLSVVFFLCVAALLPARAHARDLAEYVPADTVIYVQWDFSADIEAGYHKSSLYKFLQEEKVKNFLEKALKQTDLSTLEDEDSPITLEEAMKLAHSRVAFWVSDIKKIKHRGTDEEHGEFEYTEEKPVGGVIAEFADDEAKKVVDKLLKFADEENAKDKNINKRIEEYKGVKIDHYKFEDGGDVEEIAYFTLDDKYVITFSLDEAKKIIRIAKGEGAESLARSTLYKNTLKNLSKDRIITAFLNMSRLFKIYKEEMFNHDEEGQKVFEFLQLNDLKALGAAAIATKEQISLELYLHTPATQSPLFTLLRSGSAGFKSLELVKDDALMAFAMTIKPMEFWKTYMNMAKGINEETHKDMMEGLKDEEKKMGMSLEKDLLAHLGNEAVVIIPDADIDLMSPVPVGVVLAVRIKDKTAVEKFVKAAMAANDMEVKEKEYRGYKIYDINDDILFCFTEKYWLVGSNEDAVKEVIKTLKGDRALLTNSEKFRKARANFKGDMTALGYVGLARFFETVNNVIEKFSDDMPYGEFEGEDYPGKEKPAKEEEPPLKFPVKLLKRYFSTMVAGLKVDENGMLLKILIP